MRINVSEAYREEFEVFISKYQELCDRMIDLVVEKVSINELKSYCRSNHLDVMVRLTDTASSRDIMRGIVDNTCSITYITPLEDVIQYYITSRIEMIEYYQCSLDDYLSNLRFRYLLGSSKDIVNAETIIFILDWKPDDSFPNIRRLLYKAFIYLSKNIIVVQATDGKKNYASIKIFIIMMYCMTHTQTCRHFIVVWLIQSYFLIRIIEQ